ncbi:MBL fold metallo-hydrolase [Kineothrix sp. MB12-C1]|uniref:MBL fold metallo-hydrolase n=1 Tax=Kineothrix sp. MB12-C1 TaxID=3070215 RepID=UPI0027D28BFF|nr:MBL fold metallo-hydrolase [Kineothrix sp. MB12-C1]WMC93676.1 MBL fold metallo-hydrolase [Kineothrix sp. MB12-C1]
MKNRSLDYSEYIEIAEGVYWVGFADEHMGLHCNPYLIVDGDEAVLIDSGSRDDFSTVMLKIMRTGTSPHKIKRLIYQHYDPDLCANIPHMESVINSEELKIISHKENNLFINYYSAKSPKLCIEEMRMHFDFASGRRLQFIQTPYSHSPGSFITYDTKTKVLFSSDIFGSYDYNWNLYTQIGERCRDCEERNACPAGNKICQIEGILNFHKHNMTSKKALDYALDRIEELDISIIAPQHGSLLHTRVSMELAIECLRSLENIGIDYFLKEEKR